MDTSDYLPMFLAESEEHLQGFGLAVVRVEENPEDSETIDEIFRIAHSLKGMSATMGFERIAALTHAMEDLFEVLRVRRGGLDREAIDVVLECLDALSGALSAIERDGSESLDETALVERLNALVRSQSESDGPPQESRPDPAELAGAAGDRPVSHAVVTLAEGSLMPSVRAFMVLTAASDHGELLASLPSQDAVDGFQGGTVELWLATQHEEEAIAADLAAVPDVVEVVFEPQGAETAQAEAPAVVEPAADAPADLPAEAPAESQAPRRTGAPTGTVRVDAERLDQLMHLMGELVVHRTHIESLLAHHETPELQHAMNDLTRSSQALQAMVMQVRMIPIESVFMRFPRLVRDLSGKLDKQVELRLEGTDTELDRTVVEALGDPLVHLVRNALDHGLESAAEREAAGKPPVGTVELSARQGGGGVLISVSDDGRGIDPDRVAKKAAERGLIAAEDIPGVDLAQAVELLFSAGFSTAETTSDISGRGVGLDAVRTTIRALGGEVQVQSELGKGTTTLVRLPLSLAIVAALQVEIEERPYVLQLDRVEMTLKLEDHPVRGMAGRRMLVMRDEFLPIVDLAEALGYESPGTAAYGVAVRGGERRIVLAVDRLVGQRELVTRPLPEGVGAHPALSGGAVLSDGQIALIVDCDALIESLERPVSPEPTRT